MSYMFDEIAQQPEAIRKMVAKEGDRVHTIAEEIKKRNIRSIFLAARGTSDHSAVYGKYLFEIENGKPIGLADPSVMTMYHAKMDMTDTLVIGVSQSGGSVDINEYLASSKECGAMVIGITNEPDSQITQIADYAIFCDAGKEKSVAATKTYTTSMAAFYLLSRAMAGDKSAGDNLLACSEAMQKTMELNDYIKDRAERYRCAESAFTVSRGLNYCTALETALKLSETCYIRARGFSAADLMHGPIAAVHENDPCFLMAPPGKVFAGLKETAQKLDARSGETIIFSSEDDILSLATVPVKIPVTVAEDLSPLVYILPGQLFACHLSVAKGNNPDQPRGLSKVTITR